ncbi:MAG TPA: hypothetical protein VEW93_01185 [Acidimicrobiales bacterium]|nr:hypothetical protein [Acidimicrobiales bacterium]
MNTRALMDEYWVLVREINAGPQNAPADLQAWFDRLSSANGTPSEPIDDDCLEAITLLLERCAILPAHDPQTDTWDSRVDIFASICQLQVEWARRVSVTGAPCEVSCLVSWLLVAVICHQVGWDAPVIESYVHSEASRVRLFATFLNRCAVLDPSLSDALWDRYESRPSTCPPNPDDPYDELVRLGIVVSSALRLARRKAIQP